MNVIEAITRSCPYCGEPVDLQIDCSIDNQEYIEDCQVCCKPMVVRVDASGVNASGTDEPVVEIYAENE